MALSGATNDFLEETVLLFCFFFALLSLHLTTLRRFLFEPESDSECESEDENEEFELDDDADDDDADDDFGLLRLFCALEDEFSLCKRLAISELFASLD